MAFLFGTDASSPSLYNGAPGCLFNAFNLSVGQGTAQAAGFGDTWITSRGTIMSASCQMSGFVDGASGNSPGLASALSRTGGTVTLSFGPTETMAFRAIPTSVGVAVEYLGNQSMSVGYVSSGAIIQTWS